MTSDMVSVVIVDDQDDLRSAVAELLEDSGTISVVGEACNGAEGLETIRRARPDVVLMDLRMPVMDGIESTRRLLDEDSTAKVLIHSAFGDDSLVVDALSAGARGYVVKGSAASDLVGALCSVAAGRAHLSDEVTRPLVDRLVSALTLERTTRIAAQKAAEQLEKLNARQRIFAIQAAHELRTPLTGLIGNLELLTEASSFDVGQLPIMAGRALDAANRLERIAQHLELIASAETLSVACAPVSLASVLDEALARAGTNPRTTTCDVSPDLTVMADRTWLIHVLSETVRNAVAASPDHVTLRAEPSEGIVEITISDSGPGFPQETLDRLFEPFAQREGAASGLALGLSVVRELVGCMGGETFAENNPSGGASVRIRLERKGR